MGFCPFSHQCLYSVAVSNPDCHILFRNLDISFDFTYDLDLNKDHFFVLKQFLPSMALSWFTFCLWQVLTNFLCWILLEHLKIGIIWSLVLVPPLSMLFPAVSHLVSYAASDTVAMLVTPNAYFNLDFFYKLQIPVFISILRIIVLLLDMFGIRLIIFLLRIDLLNF